MEKYDKHKFKKESFKGIKSEKKHTKVVEKRQKTFLGHMFRHNKFILNSYEGKPLGKTKEVG